MSSTTESAVATVVGSGAALAASFQRMLPRSMPAPQGAFASSTSATRQKFQRQPKVQQHSVTLPDPAQHALVTYLCKSSAEFNKRARSRNLSKGGFDRQSAGHVPEMSTVSVVAINAQGMRSQSDGSVPGPFTVTIRSASEKALGAFLRRCNLHSYSGHWQVPYSKCRGRCYNSWASAINQADKWSLDEDTNIFWGTFLLPTKAPFFVANIGVASISEGGMEFYLETSCSLDLIMRGLSAQFDEVAANILKTVGIADGNPRGLFGAMSQALRPLLPARPPRANHGSRQAPQQVEDDAKSVASAADSLGSNSFAALLDEEEETVDAEPAAAPAAATARASSPRQQGKKGRQLQVNIPSHYEAEKRRQQQETLSFLNSQETAGGETSEEFNALDAVDESFPSLGSTYTAGPRHEPSEQEKARAMRATLITRKRQEMAEKERRAQIAELFELSKRAVKAEMEVRSGGKKTKSEPSAHVSQETLSEMSEFMDNVIDALQQMCRDTTQTSDPILIPSVSGDTENPVMVEVDAESPLPEDAIRMMLQEAVLESRPICLRVCNAQPVGRSWAAPQQTVAQAQTA